MWPAEIVRFLCNSNRALREICKVIPRILAQISRSDAWKISWKVMKKHPKSLFIKEVLHMIYFQDVCWLAAHFLKPNELKVKVSVTKWNRRLPSSYYLCFLYAFHRALIECRLRCDGNKTTIRYVANKTSTTKIRI